MKVIEVHEYKFPTHLLPALVNNESVDSEDREGFYAFLDKLEKYRIEYKASHYEVEYESDSYFAKSNCLSDVGCDVTDIRVHFIR